MRILTVLLFLAFAPFAVGKEVKFPKTVYVPVFRDPGEIDTPVGPLLVDETPVTNREFLAFVKAHHKFRRSQIAPLFVDKGYLSHWTNDTSFSDFIASHPVTHVSWFAARKFCESQGKRLPTIAEWEAFSDARSPKTEAQILAWYAKPGSSLRAVGKEPANKFGIKDSHGLIWEWVENFSEVILSGDSRGGSSTEALFCGGAALKGKDPKLYATFMRFAHRSSLTARYDSANLGFRCVKDFTEGSK